MSETSANPSKPKIRVLSLFDGIATGYYSLKQLNFDIDVYHASEIDNHALRVARHHFGVNINQLGCVKGITEDTLKEIGPIDLLLGGSPCNDLSCVNSRRKEFFDIEGTAMLFFEFYRIKTILDKSKRPYYWLFENVAGMEVKNKNIISQYLGCEPYTFNSIHLSAQSRRRFFWCNISEAEDIIKNTIGMGPLLDQYLDINLGRRANVVKVQAITSRFTCLQDGSTRDPVTEDGLITGLYITEIEKIFGFPAHFTDVGNMSTNQRHKLLGKSWSVPVIKALLEPLTKIFATTQP